MWVQVPLLLFRGDAPSSGDTAVLTNCHHSVDHVDAPKTRACYSEGTSTRIVFTRPLVSNTIKSREVELINVQADTQQRSSHVEKVREKNTRRFYKTDMLRPK
jgi:hypothetical protein